MKKLFTHTSIPTRIWRICRLTIHLLRALTYLSVYFNRLDFTARARYVTQWSQKFLALAGVKVHLQDTDCTLYTTQRPFLIANHISWLDIFVIYQASFAYFVAKAEIRHWLILGYLTRKSGALFIERQKRHETSRINIQINQMLSTGARIALFPEGTTSKGLTAQTFHASLLQPAIDAKANIIPITLRYLDSTDKHSPHADYIGETSFLRSLWQLISHRQTTALMIVGKAINCENLDRKSLTVKAHTQIANTLNSLNQLQT